MKDEIKEIITEMQIRNGRYIMCKNEDISFSDEDYQAHLLLDYITNLQEENEELREDNFAYHQLMKMQNQREYRSKFLKDFQKEHGKNVFPDYDEIYKRYDDYKTRNEKAIEYINNGYLSDGEMVNMLARQDLLNILQGSDK